MCPLPGESQRITAVGGVLAPAGLMAADTAAGTSTAALDQTTAAAVVAAVEKEHCRLMPVMTGTLRGGGVTPALGMTAVAAAVAVAVAVVAAAVLAQRPTPPNGAHGRVRLQQPLRPPQPLLRLRLLPAATVRMSLCGCPPPPPPWPPLAALVCQHTHLPTCWRCHRRCRQQLRRAPPRPARQDMLRT